MEYLYARTPAKLLSLSPGNNIPLFVAGNLSVLIPPQASNLYSVLIKQFLGICQGSFMRSMKKGKIPPLFS